MKRKREGKKNGITLLHIVEGEEIFWGKGITERASFLYLQGKGEGAREGICCREKGEKGRKTEPTFRRHEFQKKGENRRDNKLLYSWKKKKGKSRPIIRGENL